MNTPRLPLTLALFTLASCPASAQQSTMPDMPGMTMPTPPKPAAPRPNPAKPHPNAAARPSQQSTPAQQSMPTPPPDAPSITRPYLTLQEPEAPTLTTGTALPAPELLTAVLSRPPLSLDYFLTLADQSNPTLAEAARNIDRSQAQARQAGLPPDPTLGYSGDHIRGGSYHAGEQGAFFSQTFVLGRKLAARSRIYLTEAQSNQLALKVQRARVHDDVARTFLHTLANEQLVSIQARLLAVALDSQTNAHELERTGQADAADVLSAEIAAEQSRTAFEDAQRAFLAAYAQLATLAGQPTLEPHPLTGALTDPPALDPDALVTQDAAQSPYVKLAESNATAAESRLADARRERIPDLTVKAAEWYSGEALGATNIKAGWESFAEAGVQIPLWNRNQGNTAAARAELDRAHQDVLRTQLWTRNQLAPFAQQYLAARSAATRYRDAMLPRARRAFDLEVLKYQQMALAYPHVLTAQRTLFELQRSYIQSLDQEWQAALALEHYALSNGLDTPFDWGDDSTTLNLPTSQP